MNHPSLLLSFAGDRLEYRARPMKAFGAKADVLRWPDVLFGNLEASFTDNTKASSLP